MTTSETPQSAKPASNFILRTYYSLAMMGSFLFLCVFVGQIACGILVFFLQIGMWREVIRIADSADKAITPGATRKVRVFSRKLHSYFFLVCVYFCYVRGLKRVLLKSFPGPTTEAYLRAHNFTCFSLYIVGFVCFIISLKHKCLTRQFAQLVWNHMALLYLAAQASLFISPMWEGMIWFLLPTSIIIANDIWAYICGKLLGRTKLWALSPKKTVEGFVGAIFVTILWGLFASWAFSEFPRLICTKETLWPLGTPTSCDINPIYLWREYDVPSFIAKALESIGLGLTTITIKPIMLHSLSFSLFGSIVGPFGGFFASGLKRAFKIKDFGDLIPGHGGVMDRMDCQILMATFTYVYVDNFIRASGGFCSSPSLIRHCVQRLPVAEQAQLLNQLVQHLVQNGAAIINGTAVLPAM